MNHENIFIFIVLTDSTRSTSLHVEGVTPKKWHLLKKIKIGMGVYMRTPWDTHVQNTFNETPEYSDWAIPTIELDKDTFSMSKCILHHKCTKLSTNVHSNIYPQFNLIIK